jgi:hypothetical protein
MERWLYESLLSLSWGNSVQFEEIRGFKLWSTLVDWLKANNIKYNRAVIGRGMWVDYVFTIDGRCTGRLGQILSKYKQNLCDLENL